MAHGARGARGPGGEDDGAVWDGPEGRSGTGEVGGGGGVGAAGAQQQEVSLVVWKRRRFRRRRVVVILSLVAVAVVVAATAVLVVFLGRAPREGPSISLKEYEEKPFGDVLIMRHALAPGGGDPEGFTLGDCSTQRNLGAEGIAQATEIGRKLAEISLLVGKKVYTSQWCRCQDTASLVVTQLNNSTATPAPGHSFTVEEEWGLNSFYQPELGFTKSACMKRLDESILGRLRDIPIKDRDGRATLMVTHKVTVSAVTGVSTSSGEIVVYDSKLNEARRLVL